MHRTWGVLMSLALAVGAACGGEEQRPADEVGAEPAVSAAAAVSEAEAVAIGDSAAVALSRALMSRVQAALQEGGPAYAIEFCSERALAITAAVQDSLADGLELKRTSMRIRNPANAPDSLERAALAHFQSALDAGRPLPPYHVQQTGDGWRYYKPIVVADFCTACHGPRESLDPAVRQVLAERYPNDQATGYSAGDFRGVIRVSVPASGGR
jgi:hypothetical protein